MSSPTGREPARSESMSADPRDYLTGPTSDTVNPTEGGTTRDGGVAVFGQQAQVEAADDEDDD